MSFSVYDVVASLARPLNNLDAIVSKAEEFAKEKEIDPDVLIQARLRPDMLPFVAQIRIATDIAKGAVARLSGSDPEKWADDETTFEDIHTRLRKGIDVVSSIGPAQFEGAEDRDIVLNIRGSEMRFKGRDYLLGFVIPNVYFHVTTAYDILRFNGLDIGKMDFIGAP